VLKGDAPRRIVAALHSAMESPPRQDTTVSGTGRPQETRAR
jgi:hypothetical protein